MCAVRIVERFTYSFFECSVGSDRNAPQPRSAMKFRRRCIVTGNLAADLGPQSAEMMCRRSCGSMFCDTWHVSPGFTVARFPPNARARFVILRERAWPPPQRSRHFHSRVCSSMQMITLRKYCRCSLIHIFADAYLLPRLYVGHLISCFLFPPPPLLLCR